MTLMHDGEKRDNLFHLLYSRDKDKIKNKIVNKKERKENRRKRKKSTGTTFTDITNELLQVFFEIAFFIVTSPITPKDRKKQANIRS